MIGAANSFTHLFNHLFREQGLSSFYMLITELGTGDINMHNYYSHATIKSIPNVLAALTTRGE